VNRVGRLPARPRPISTRLADRLHGPRGHAYLPPPPNGSTSTVGPSNGPDERPAAAGTREESTATAATTRTANSSTAGATDSSDEGGSAQGSDTAGGGVGNDPSTANGGSDEGVTAAESTNNDSADGTDTQGQEAYHFGTGEATAIEGGTAFNGEFLNPDPPEQQGGTIDGGETVDGANNPAEEGDANNADEEEVTAEEAEAAADAYNADGANGGDGDDEGEPPPPVTWEWEDIREDDPHIHAYSECDQLLVEVYGDTIHRNTGDHMPGGIDIVQDHCKLNPSYQPP